MYDGAVRRRRPPSVARSRLRGFAGRLAERRERIQNAFLRDLIEHVELEMAQVEKTFDGQDGDERTVARGRAAQTLEDAPVPEKGDEGTEDAGDNT